MMQIILALVFLILAGGYSLAQVRAIAEAPHGGVWIAEGNEVRRGSAKQVIYKADGEIQSFLGDKKGNYWIATESGLLRLDASGAPHEKILSTPVRALTADASGNVWAAGDTELYEIRGSAVHKHPLPKATNTVEAILIDHGGSVWIASRGGIVQQRNGTPEFISHNFGNSIAEDQSGAIWVGSGNDLLKIQEGKTETFSLPPPAANVRMTAPITSVLCTRSKRVLIGTSSGVFELDTGKFRKVAGFDTLCLFETKDGSIWAGTGQGLRKLP